MTDVFVGSVAVGVVPDARGWNERMRQQIIPPSKAIGDEAGTEMGKAITDKMGESGDESAGAFDREFKKRLKLALDSLPKAKLEADATEVDIKLEEIRARIDALRKDKLIDPERAAHEIDRIAFDLTRLRLQARDIKLDFDTKEATAQLLLLRGLGAKAGSGAGGGILKDISSAEAAIQTATGAAGAGSGLFGNLLTMLGFGKGGGGAAAGTAAQGAGGFSMSGLVSAIMSPEVLIPAVISILPIVMSALGGLIVSVFGGILAGTGIASSAMSGGLSKSWANFSKTAGTSFKGIGAQSGMTSMLNQTIQSATQMITVVMGFIEFAISEIAGPLGKFFQANITAFQSANVNAAFAAIGKAFGAILNAITPNVTTYVNDFADALTALANTIAANPQAFVDFITWFNDMITDFLRIVNFFAKTYNVMFPPGQPNPSSNIPFVGGIVGLLQRFGIVGGAPLPIGQGGGGGGTGAMQGIINWFKSLLPTPSGGPGGYAAAGLTPGGPSTYNPNVPGGPNVPVPTAPGKPGVPGISIPKITIPTITLPKIKFGPNNLNVDSSGLDTKMNKAGSEMMIHFLMGIQVVWNNQIHIFFATTIPNDLTKLFKPIGNNFYDGGSNMMDQMLAGLSNDWLVKAPTLFHNLPINLLKGGWNLAVDWAKLGTTFSGWILQGMATVVVGPSAGSWVKSHVVDPLIGILTSAQYGFNTKSPSKKMVPLGRQVVEGIVHGMFVEGKSINRFVAKIFGDWPHAIISFISRGFDPNKLGSAAKKLMSSVGMDITKIASSAWHFITGGSRRAAGGVAQWAGVVSKALTMLHLPQALSGQVLYQIQTESGGNPNAINLWDANARRGDPSRGLLQTIGATFSQYHVPGTSRNIFDPLANVAAAINYAMHRYGPGLMRGGSGLGSGHGYDVGGWLPPGATLAINNTGRPELVLTADQMAHMGTQYHAHFDGLTGAAIESHVRTAFMAMSLTQATLARQGRRS